MLDRPFDYIGAMQCENKILRKKLRNTNPVNDIKGLKKTIKKSWRNIADKSSARNTNWKTFADRSKRSGAGVRKHMPML